MAVLAALILLAGVACLPYYSHSFPTIEKTNNAENVVNCINKADDGSPTNTPNGQSSNKCANISQMEQESCDPQSTGCSAVELEPDYDCATLSDGLFITPHSLCRRYYRCRNGTREDFSCPEQSYFDIASQFCVQTEGVCYELVCSGRVNGRYADTSHDCRRSYVCEGGSLRSLTSCPSGTRYNGTSCEHSERVKCVDVEKSAVAIHIPPSDPCIGLPNGFQTAQDESCRGYFLCHSGQTIAKLRCAPGDHFNGVECAPADESTCVSYCSGKPDGYNTDLRQQCRSFVNCFDGRVIEELTCRDGFVYNGKTCVPAFMHECPLPSKRNVCFKLKNGYYHDYMSGCKDYFYCHEGQVLLKSSCDDGKVWDGTDCVPPGEFLCQGPEFWPGCSGLEEGLYPELTQSSKCKFYHYCSDGKRVRLRCPDGFLFNGKKCVRESSYSCPFFDSDCYNKKDGYYADKKSGCRSYYFCSDGHKITYICSDRQVFNGSDCVEPQEFECPSRENICANKTNGYHADESSGCHNYVYCLQGVMITSFECPEGNVFDGKKCIQFQTVDCFNVKQTCDDAEDGLYTEANSNCQTYFNCTDKKRTKTLTCREGKVFNGTHCVKYICPSKYDSLQRKEDCEGKIGFFQDYESHCNKYYFCINGVKTMLSCKSGEVFNGGLCTSDQNYTCPTELDQGKLKL